MQVMRGPKRKGVRYFGPYSHAWAIRETLDLLLRVFPARTCSKGVYKRAQQVGRPCLFGYIDKCSAPCVGRVTTEEHREIVNDFCDFLAGQTTRFLRRLETQMREASDAQEYERAARLRDDIGALRRAIEKQAVVLPDDTDADAVAFAQDELEAAVFVFHVRGGRVRGPARLRRRQARRRGSPRAGRALRVAGLPRRRLRRAARGARPGGAAQTPTSSPNC